MRTRWSGLTGLTLGHLIASTRAQRPFALSCPRGLEKMRSRESRARGKLRGGTRSRNALLALPGCFHAGKHVPKPLAMAAPPSPCRHRPRVGMTVRRGHSRIAPLHAGHDFYFCFGRWQGEF